MVNVKHSEVDKFMVQQLSCEFYFILNELKDEGKTELELLVSILDYLGFKYVERLLIRIINENFKTWRKI
jgi:hypothetical protein